MSNIVDFYDAHGLGINLVGGKGLNLSIMISKGIDVPSGFIILSSVYERFLTENKVDEFIINKIKLINDDNSDVILNDIRDKIINSDFSIKIKDEIKRIFNSFEKPVHLAVRSSATAEDLKDASFAGQQETYLNVTSLKDLIYNIKCCFASLWTKRAYEYRKINGYNHLEVSIAVVVQKMVNSEISGVMFTSDPLYSTDEIFIDASYGLGEAIVSGQVTPDNCILDSNGNIKSYKLGTKKIKMIYSSNGIQKVETNLEERKKRCLSDNDLSSLWKASNKIKELYCTDMDIEWAIEKGQLYILQARQITTIENTSKKNIIQYNLGKKEKKYLNNMIEHFPILWYPLDDDVAMILQNMKYDLLKDVGINITNPLKMNDNGIIDMEKIKVKFNFKIFKYPFVYKEYKNDAFNIKYSVDELDIIKKQVKQFETEVLSYDEKTEIKCVVKVIDKLIELHKKISYIRFRYILFPSVILGEKLDKILRKINNKYVEYDLLSNLDYMTVYMNRDLDILIKKLSLNDNFIQAIKNKITLSELKANYEKEYYLLQDFLDEYGWKSNFCCIPFSSESWYENPKRLLDLIILTGNELFIEENNLSKYNIIVDEVKERYNEKKNTKILNDIEIYRKYHVLRENSQYLWETVFGLLRFAVKNVSLKINVSYEDILYLTIDELRDLMLNNVTIDNFLEIINNRKSKRKIAEKKWDSMIISIFSNTNTDKFSGVSGSNGVAKGKVRIIKNHSEFNKLKTGDVLVCPYTDPEWTPLFKIAKAVIADTGGALSHAAIVAREYGIPAVLGVGNATNILKDGDVVIVNGDKGIVEKLI